LENDNNSYLHVIARTKNLGQFEIRIHKETHIKEVELTLRKKGKSFSGYIRKFL
jgi:hypothetical protein